MAEEIAACQGWSVRRVDAQFDVDARRRHRVRSVRGPPLWRSRGQSFGLVEPDEFGELGLGLLGEFPAFLWPAVPAPYRAGC